jgi:hypothetical protein
MSKSNARWAGHGARVAVPAEGEEGEEEEDEKKHLAPQHRRFLSHPEIGPGALDRALAARASGQLTAPPRAVGLDQQP